MQTRETSRHVSRTLKQLFLILKDQPASILGTAGRERAFSRASDSTCLRPPRQKNGPPAAPDTGSTRTSHHAARVTESENVSHGPRRKEVLELIAESGAKSISTARSNLNCLRIQEIKPMLGRWGYETEGLKKQDLVRQMQEAIQDEDRWIAMEKAAAGKHRGKKRSKRPAATTVGALLRAALLAGHKSQFLPEPTRPAARPAEPNTQERPKEGGTPATSSSQEPDKLEALTPSQVAEWLTDARTEDVVVLHVEDVCPFADQLVIASGRSNQHVHAAASGLCWQISQKVKHYDRPNCLYKEGGEDSDWIAIDTGKIVVHVMTKEARELYNLEELWDKRHAISHSDEETYTDEQVQMGVL